MKIILLLFIALSLFNLTAQPFKRQVIVEEGSLHGTIIQDGVKAPIIRGSIYHHHSDIKFNDTNNFVQTLKKTGFNYLDKATIIVFWEIADMFSKLIINKLETVANNYNNTNLQIILVNTNDFDDKQQLITFLNTYNNTEYTFIPDDGIFDEFVNPKHYQPLTNPILFANKKVKDEFGITAFPSTIVIDNRGYVVTAMIGYFNEYDIWLTNLIRDFELLK